PFERLGELVCISLLLLAFGFASWPRTSGWNLFFLNLGLALIFYITTAVRWYGNFTANPSLSYNHSFEAAIWAGWSALICIAGLGMTLSAPRGEGLSGAAFTVMALGQLLQMVAPVAVPHIPLWVRWADLVAYPLFGASVYARLLGKLGPRPLAIPRGESPQEAEAIRHFFETTHRGSISLDAPAVLENAALGIARALKVEQCFILLLDEENPNQVYLAALCKQGALVRKTLRFPLDQNPVLREAFRLKHQVVVKDPRSLERWQNILQTFGCPSPRFLVLHPLLSREEVIGLLGICNSASGAPLANWQVQLLKLLVGDVSTSLERAKLYRSLEKKAENLAWQLHNREKEIAKYKALFEEEKARQQEDMEIARDRIAQLEEQVRTLQEERKLLEKEAHKTRKEAEEFKAKVVAQSTELQGLRDQLQSLLERGSPQASDELLEALPVGLIMCDKRGNITWGNKAVERILGWPTREFVGQPLSSFSEDPEWVKALEEAFGGDKKEVTASLEIGGRFIKAELIRLDEKLLVVLIDLTEEVQAQRDKDQFLASLAADVRNPMTAIMGYTDLLLSESVGLIGDMQRRFLLRIKSNIERLSKLLTDLVSVAAVDSGRLRLKLTLVEMGELVEEALLTVRAQIESSGMKLEMDIQEDLPPVEMDFDRMKHVLTTLLTNAIECSPRGSTIRLEVKAEPPEEEAKYVRITVTDAGGGVAPEDLSRVFTRFYRADQSLIRGLGERGVGLALVKTLVELHGGRIWAESRMGEGTSFIILLPICQARLPRGISQEAEDVE
ncbi:MAG: hypothetical protein DRI61_14365, partial [Chloroflexi bacterium]